MADVEGVIQERIAEIDREKRRLEAALTELAGGKRPTRRRKRTSSNARPADTTKPGERPRQILAHLERNPGARPTEIAGAIKASPNQVHTEIAKLRKDKLIRKRGKGYGLAPAAQRSRPVKSTAGTRASQTKASGSRRRSATR